MKKRIVLIILIALSAFSLSAKPIDVVVMLDTSESVLPIYEDLVDYIVKNVLTNHVRFGDTFHLISFDSKPELIYSRQLKDSKDLEEVVAGLLLLNPLGKHTDLVMALKYLNQHVSSLSEGSSCEIIILTDGIHDPPPGSPFQEIIIYDEKTGEKINLLENEINSISRFGWKVSLVKLPQNISDTTSDKSSDNNSAELNDIDKSSGSLSKTDIDNSGSNTIAGENNFSQNIQTESTITTNSPENNIFTFTENGKSKIYQTEFNGSQENGNQTATGSPRITYPEDLGKIRYHFSLPVEIENFFDKPILLKLDSVMLNSSDILKEQLNIKLNEKQKKKVSIDLLLPYSELPGSNELDLKLVFSDTNRAYPETAVISVTLKKSFSDFIKDINILFKILFLILIAAVLVIFFFIFFSSFVHVSVKDSYKVIKKDFEEMVSDKNLRPVALKVIGQNDSRIGSRNIHSFNDKAVKTIGGGHSSYLIFLYKIKPHIAEITHEENKYFLKIVEKEYFPLIKDEISEVKMNEIFKIKTEKNMLIECFFYEYISPLEKINTIMKLTDHRGLPDGSIYAK